MAKSTDFSNMLEAFTGKLKVKGTSEAAPLERRDAMMQGGSQSPISSTLTKAKIKEGDPGWIPKEYQVWATTSTGRKMVYDKRRPQAYQRRTPKAPEVSRKSKRIVSTEAKRGSLASFVAATVPKTKTASERKYKLSTGSRKLRTNIGRKGKGRRRARTKRSLQTHPITGEVRGRGVKRIPSETLQRLKYGGTNVAVRTGLAGVQAGLEGLYERLGHKARDVVSLARMDPEMRAHERVLRVKRVERKQRAVETLRRHGVFDAKEPSMARGLGREISDSMRITAASQTAKFVTELIGRKIPFYPIEVRVNPDKMKAMIDYNRDKRTGNIYMRLARTQGTINDIEDGRAMGDPKYNVPETDGILMELYRVKRDIESEAERRYGRGWLRAKSERERAALIELTIDTKKVFDEAFQSARSRGYKKQSAYDLAYKYTARMMGTSPISQRALADVASIHANIPETVPQATKNRQSHKQDFVAQTNRAMSITDAQMARQHKDDISAREQATSEMYRRRGGITRESRPEATQEVNERIAHLKARKDIESRTRAGAERETASMVTRRMRQWKDPSEKKHLQHLNRLVHSGEYSAALRYFDRHTIGGKVDKDTASEIMAMLHQERIDKTPKYGPIRLPRKSMGSQAGKHVNPRHIGGETRRGRTRELEDLEGSVQNLDQLRDAVGHLQSQGVMIKQMTSAPVSGLALVRQDLHSKKNVRQMKRTGHRRRRYYAT